MVKPVYLKFNAIVCEKVGYSPPEKFTTPEWMGGYTTIPPLKPLPQQRGPGTGEYNTGINYNSGNRVTKLGDEYHGNYKTKSSPLKSPPPQEQVPVVLENSGGTYTSKQESFKRQYQQTANQWDSKTAYKEYKDEMQKLEVLKQRKEMYQNTLKELGYQGRMEDMKNSEMQAVLQNLTILRDIHVETKIKVEVLENKFGFSPPSSWSFE
ncbi:hypothetical protein [Veronia pacifica]|uniref:Uncharacterized protein n=1 Tax=Veronia pacifica TaxID=1080227 RepID=A0A1C3EGB1_9GAMM|nr:hypothetical protein [Veronia pacifica]ODA32268.1 hypothetical protein A8L45_13845 [Veronia pacifica]